MLSRTLRSQLGGYGAKGGYGVRALKGGYGARRAVTTDAASAHADKDAVPEVRFSLLSWRVNWDLCAQLVF